MNKDKIKEDIITITKLHPSKIRNIYLYGSRIYGTYTPSSDYDAIVVACSLYVNHEIFDGQYNLHITTPDVFEDQLEQHDIHNLECIFAPEEAKIQITKDYKDFKTNTWKLRKMLLSQSAWSWSKAQRRIEKNNIIGGIKSLFHSFRILKFGLQIMEFGRILDFSEANDIWEKLNNCEYLEWYEYQDVWLPIRKEIITKFKRSANGSTGIERAKFSRFGIKNLVPLSDAFEKIGG